MSKEMTQAEQFARFMESRKGEAAIVDVLAPSGFVYKFEKPSKFALIFGAGKLPQVAASGAVTDWTEAGIVKAIQEGNPDILKIAQEAFTTRDKVLALSHSPKWVIGKADPAKNEISTDDIPDEDIDYCLKWVQAGGDVSMMLKTFPQGSQPSPVVKPNRKARRAASK